MKYLILNSLFLIGCSNPCPPKVYTFFYNDKVEIIGIDFFKKQIGYVDDLVYTTDVGDKCGGEVGYRVELLGTKKIIFVYQSQIVKIKE
jgi:hypothetical protein